MRVLGAPKAVSWSGDVSHRVPVGLNSINCRPAELVVIISGNFESLKSEKHGEKANPHHQKDCERNGVAQAFCDEINKQSKAFLNPKEEHDFKEALHDHS